MHREKLISVVSSWHKMRTRIVMLDGHWTYVVMLIIMIIISVIIVACYKWVRLMGTGYIFQIKRVSYVARNGNIHSTERVAFLPHYSVY